MLRKNVKLQSRAQPSFHLKKNSFLKTFPFFYKIGGLLRSSNKQRTEHYLEHVESNLNSSTPFLLNTLYYYSLIPDYILSALFLLVFPIKVLYAFLTSYIRITVTPTLSTFTSLQIISFRIIRFTLMSSNQILPQLEPT
jgi:hypothetical protein